MGKRRRRGSRADGGDGLPILRLGADDTMQAQLLPPSLDCRGIAGQPVWLMLCMWEGRVSGVELPLLAIASIEQQQGRDSLAFWMDKTLFRGRPCTVRDWALVFWPVFVRGGQGGGFCMWSNGRGKATWAAGGWISFRSCLALPWITVLRHTPLFPKERVFLCQRRPRPLFLCNLSFVLALKGHKRVAIGCPVPRVDFFLLFWGCIFPFPCAAEAGSTPTRRQKVSS